jgi:hypothetical protein
LVRDADIGNARRHLAGIALAEHFDFGQEGQ